MLLCCLCHPTLDHVLNSTCPCWMVAMGFQQCLVAHITLMYTSRFCRIVRTSQEATVSVQFATSLQSGDSTHAWALEFQPRVIAECQVLLLQLAKCA